MMPALVRVGAVTSRTRDLYVTVQIPVCEDTRVLESLEDDAGRLEVLLADA
jgi:hypothetical protein